MLNSCTCIFRDFIAYRIVTISKSKKNIYSILRKKKISPSLVGRNVFSCVSACLRSSFLKSVIEFISSFSVFSFAIAERQGKLIFQVQCHKDTLLYHSSFGGVLKPLNKYGRWSIKRASSVSTAVKYSGVKIFLLQPFILERLNKVFNEF